MQSIIIYAIERIGTDKCYVGSTKNGKLRKRLHIKSLRKGTHHSLYLQRSWDKYGEKAFQFKVLERCLAKERVEAETHWIEHSNSCYNMMKAVDGNLVHTRATRKKISVAKKGKRPTKAQRKNIKIAAQKRVKKIARDPQLRAKISASIKAAQARPEYKAKCKKTNARSDVKARRSAAAKRAQNRPEVKAAKSRAHKGKPKPLEQRKKIGDALLGRSKGPHSPMHKARIRAAMKQYWAARRRAEAKAVKTLRKRSTAT